MLSTYTAKNLDDALREACIKKDCRIDELTYNVLEENKGFLGIGSSVKIEAYCLNDVKEFLFDYLGNFFTNANIECSVEIFQKDDSFTIMLDAENNAVLIGKNGKTLQAINTVVKSAVNSEFKRKFSTVMYKNLKIKLGEMSFSKDFINDTNGNLYPIAEKSDNCVE